MAITRTATAIVPDAGTPVTRTATAIVPDAGTPVTRTATAIVPDVLGLTLYTTAQGAGQFTPTLTLAVGAPVPHWDFGDGTSFDGTAVDHNYADAGTKTVTITPFSIVDYIAGIDFAGCNLTGDIGEGFLRWIPSAISSSIISLYKNSASSNVAKIPSGAMWYYFWSFSPFGNIANLPECNPAQSGKLYFPTNTAFESGMYGDLSSLRPIQVYDLRFGNFTGTLSDLPLCQDYWFSSSTINAGSISHLTTLQRLDVDSVNWTQPDVDLVIASIYNARANYTYANPVLNIGGNNAAPSGVYQYPADPANPTGKEMIYILVNDPDAEGFNKWTITYTA